MSNSPATLARILTRLGRPALLATFAVILGAATASIATPDPRRDVGATLGNLEAVGLERRQRPAVIQLIETYFRAVGTIQERLASGALEADEAARQAELAFDHLEQRLGDVLDPDQLARYRQLKAQAERRAKGRR